MDEKEFTKLFNTELEARVNEANIKGMETFLPVFKKLVDSTLVTGKMEPLSDREFIIATSVITAITKLILMVSMGGDGDIVSDIVSAIEEEYAND